MQYLSSMILEYLPFVASSDFQIVISAMMAMYIAVIALKKLFKILYKTIKFGFSIAVIAALFYVILVGNPIKDKEQTIKYIKNEMPTVIALLNK